MRLLENVSVSLATHDIKKDQDSHHFPEISCSNQEATSINLCYSLFSIISILTHLPSCRLASVKRGLLARLAVNNQIKSWMTKTSRWEKTQSLSPQSQTVIMHQKQSFLLKYLAIARAHCCLNKSNYPSIVHPKVPCCSRIYIEVIPDRTEQPNRLVAGQIK